MCAQHRSETIADIKAALTARREAWAKGEQSSPVRVVSTQLVEAGVDLDFPVVYRAMAGLDSIAQAAGRCNREGKLPILGEMHVFVPPTKSPPGLLSPARDTCKAVWHDHPEQPFALPLIERNFRRLYHDASSTDQNKICDLLTLQIDRYALSLPVQFRDASEAFKLIDDKESATVLVRYRSPNAKAEVNALISAFRSQTHRRSFGLSAPTRWKSGLKKSLEGTTIPMHISGRLRACWTLFTMAHSTVSEGIIKFFHSRIGPQCHPNRSAVLACSVFAGNSATDYGLVR